MGPGGGAHAPRCAALKTMLLRNEVSDGDAIITLWGRRAARTRHGVPITSLSYLLDAAAWRDQFSQMYLQLYNYNAIPYE